jgi:hypothetical protein
VFVEQCENPTVVEEVVIGKQMLEVKDLEMQNSAFKFEGFMM